jgi:hypothetical protein
VSFWELSLRKTLWLDPSWLKCDSSRRLLQQQKWKSTSHQGDTWYWLWRQTYGRGLELPVHHQNVVVSLNQHVTRHCLCHHSSGMHQS